VELTSQEDFTMGTYQFPGGPAQSREIAKLLAAGFGDRRSFFKRAAGLGLAMPVLGGLALQVQTADAQDEHDMEGTPESGYVGSDPESPSTGDESPVPTEVQPYTRYDPVLAPVEAGPQEITIVARDASLYIAKDVPYAAWTFDGTVPGRALRVVEGDEIKFTLQIDPTILPGDEFSWSFAPKHPGAFMYHCGTPPVLMHIGTGMYGAMIVDPKDGWPEAQELVFVQSDFYLMDGENGIKVPDYTKMMGNGAMDYVVFNGYANQYVDNPIMVKVGEPIRIFLVNGGPNAYSTFHVVGAIFDRVCVNAHPRNELFGLQSWTVGPGDGACFEFTLEEPGIYPAVNHAFGHAAHGAAALLQAE
jgi:nitrite reductase (NO-forming)